MSSIWKKPTFSKRQQENHWMNTIFQTHDLFCHCEDPPLHLMVIINKNSNAPKPEDDIKNIKCLLTGEGGTANRTEEDDVGLRPGELEELFKEEEPAATG